MNITGRDNMILAKALFVASRYLKKQKDPELGDIADMEAILREAFPGTAESLELLDSIKTAHRLGIFDGCKEGDSFDPTKLRKLIEAKRDRDNVVEF